MVSYDDMEDIFELYLKMISVLELWERDSSMATSEQKFKSFKQRWFVKDIDKKDLKKLDSDDKDKTYWKTNLLAKLKVWQQLRIMNISGW